MAFDSKLSFVTIFRYHICPPYLIDMDQKRSQNSEIVMQSKGRLLKRTLILVNCIPKVKVRALVQLIVSA